MSDSTDERGANLASGSSGLSTAFEPAELPPVSQIEIAASIVSVLWLVLCGIYFIALPARDTSGSESGTEALVFLMTAMVVFFPVAMIWVAATAARASRVMREESLRLRAAIDAIRKAYVTQSQRGATEPSMARKLDEISAATRKTEAALTLMATSHAVAPPAPAPASALSTPAGATSEEGEQPKLALGTQVEELAPPLSSEDFIRALNFPETAEDQQGFAALRRALKDRPTGQLVQASQDVLTLISQDGVYMDDLRPDLARVEVWRSFADGTRGRAVAALGGIRDRSSLALAHGRLKQDPIFRDAAHHFLRVFDRVFSDFAKRASDAELQAFANTRTARAFMLIGRVAGTFD